MPLITERATDPTVSWHLSLRRTSGGPAPPDCELDHSHPQVSSALTDRLLGITSAALFLIQSLERRYPISLTNPSQRSGEQ